MYPYKVQVQSSLHPDQHRDLFTQEWGNTLATLFQLNNQLMDLRDVTEKA